MTTAKQSRMTSAHADPAAGLLALDEQSHDMDIMEALDLMRARRATQLWVCGGCTITRDADALERARRAGWDIKLSPRRGDAGPVDLDDPARDDDWLLCYRVGEYTPAGYSLVWPALDPRRVWWDRDADGNPTQPPQDAQTLRAALATYARAVGIAYYRTPRATGASLLRSLHHGLHATALDAPADMPPPARRSEQGGVDTQDGPLMWRRAVAPDELDRAPWLLTFDVNAQFLRAANGLPLGFGPVTHLEAERAQLFVAMAYQREQPTEGKRLIAPGYYRIRMNPRAAITRLPMPHPLYRAATPDAPFSAAGCWVSAPTVRLLIEQRLPFVTHEAYVWRESHRFLDPWYTRLTAARTALREEPGAAGALARTAAKFTYTHFFGGLADPRRGEKDALYRPDWRHADISEARALHYRNLLTAVDRGYWPVLVTEDTLGFLCESGDVAEMAAALGLRVSDTVGHYKIKDRLDLRRRDDVYAALLDPSGDARKLQGLLSQVRRQEREAERETEREGAAS